MIRTMFQSLAVCALLFAALPADAQPKVVKPTDIQVELNQQGFKASQAEDYEGAIDAFKASLGRGELNVTWLNLGRAYQKADRCKNANNAYAKALTAPIADVRTPTPEEVQSYVDKFRTELRETCPGELVVTCSPSDLTITIDGEDAQPCPTEAIELPPGKAIVRGELWEWSASQTVQIEALETVMVALSIPATGAQIQAREHFQNGMTAQTAGRNGDAERAFEEAATLDPAWPEPRRRLAAMAMDADDLDTAARHTGLLLQIVHESERAKVESDLNGLKAKIDQRKADALAKDLKKPDPKKTDPKPVESGGGGIWWLLGGAVAGGAGAALDTLPNSASNFEMDALDIVPLGLYAGGLTLGVIGLVELLGAESPDPNAPQ